MANLAITVEEIQHRLRQAATSFQNGPFTLRTKLSVYYPLMAVKLGHTDRYDPWRNFELDVFRRLWVSLDNTVFLTSHCKNQKHQYSDRLDQTTAQVDGGGYDILACGETAQENTA